MEKILDEKRTWLVTGCAGFIGSNIVEKLLAHGQSVRGIDNLSTGSYSNIKAALKEAGSGADKRFTFYEGDILDSAILGSAIDGAQYLLHHAAVVSVPESIKNPALTKRVNEDGFAAVAKMAAEHNVKRMIYASSSAVYGSDPTVPKKEDMSGDLQSPYAVSKMSNEQYSRGAGSAYKMEFAGLRYFNVFGPRQDPSGAYAAVIPQWINTLIKGEQVVINGDPGITRDFIYIDNVVDANIRAALGGANSAGEVFNIGAGKATTLMELFDLIKTALNKNGISSIAEPSIGPERAGDIKHSWADISRAREALGYRINVNLEEGLIKTIDWMSK
jgi:UDP-N-acetylglucosamine 4-epimerase